MRAKDRCQWLPVGSLRKAAGRGLVRAVWGPPVRRPDTALSVYSKAMFASDKAHKPSLRRSRVMVKPHEERLLLLLTWTGACSKLCKQLLLVESWSQTAVGLSTEMKNTTAQRRWRTRKRQRVCDGRLLLQIFESHLFFCKPFGQAGRNKVKKLK